MSHYIKCPLIYPPSPKKKERKKKEGKIERGKESIPLNRIFKIFCIYKSRPPFHHTFLKIFYRYK
jgi:hypothetical protein